MTEDVQEPNELAKLKQRADLLGLTYSNNIGAETLAKKIEDHLAALDGNDPSNKEEEEKSKKPAKTRADYIAEATKLVRLRITNMNPMKKDMPGEFFTVANGMIGTVKKYVPYNGEAAEQGWHVPNVIYKMLKSRTFTMQVKQRDEKGRPVMVPRVRKEFALEVLPPLTKEELEKLAQDQRAAGRV